MSAQPLFSKLIINDIVVGLGGQNGSEACLISFDLLSLTLSGLTQSAVALLRMADRYEPA